MAGAPPVQANTSGGTGGSTTNTQSFTTAVTNGNLLVLYIFDSTGATSTISSVTWSAGGACGTFTKTPMSPITGGSRQMWVYYAQITSGGCTGVTVTFSASINSIVIFAEYAGLATSAVLDAENGATGIGTALNSGNITTANASDLLVGGLFVTTSGGGTLAAGSGFTLRVNNASSSHRGLEDQNVSATGTYAATATYSSSQTWIAHVMALKFAPTGPTARGNIDFDQVRAAARHGTGGQFQMFTGTATSGHAAVFDASGNVIDGGTPATTPLVIGFVINSGATGTNVGPMLAAARAGSFTKCVVTTKASDGSTALTFTIKQNGTSVFSTNPTVSAGTGAGTVFTFTTLTSSPLPIVASDVFSIDITSGTANWQFTAQLE